MSRKNLSEEITLKIMQLDEGKRSQYLNTFYYLRENISKTVNASADTIIELIDIFQPQNRTEQDKIIQDFLTTYNSVHYYNYESTIATEELE